MERKELYDRYQKYRDGKEGVYLVDNEYIIVIDGSSDGKKGAKEITARKYAEALNFIDIEKKDDKKCFSIVFKKTDSNVLWFTDKFFIISNTKAKETATLSCLIFKTLYISEGFKSLKLLNLDINCIVSNCYIPDTTKKIEQMFFRFRKISNLSFPNTQLDLIDTDAFYEMRIDNNTFKVNVKKMSSGAFRYMKAPNTEIIVKGEFDENSFGTFRSTKFKKIDLSDMKTETIPRLAFGNANINQIILPRTITILKQSAFRNTHGKLFYADGDPFDFSKLTYIGQDTFTLAEINFPPVLELNARTVGMNAFSGINNIQKLKVNGEFSNYELGAFIHSSVTEVEWGAKYVPTRCFKGSRLEKFSYTNIKSIDSSAFSSTPLKSFYLSESLERIDASAFNDCIELTFSYDSNNPKIIKDNDFLAFKANEEQTILLEGKIHRVNDLPAYITDYPNIAFCKCDVYQDKLILPKTLQAGNPNKISGRITQIDFTSKPNTWGIRDKLNLSHTEALELQEVPPYVYEYEKNLVWKVKTQERDSYTQNNIIQVFNIPLDNFVYFDCDDPTTIKNIKSRTKYIESGYEDFSGWVVNQSLLPTIKQKYKNSNIQIYSFGINLAVPSRSKKIKDAVSSLSDAITAEIIAKADEPLLDNGVGVQYIYALPFNTIKIGENAFQNSVGMTKVIINEGCEEISDNAFADCKDLKEVVIPPSVKKIGWDVFNGCSKLERIVFLGKFDSWNNIEKDDFWDSGINDILIKTK